MVRVVPGLLCADYINLIIHHREFSKRLGKWHGAYQIYKMNASMHLGRLTNRYVLHRYCLVSTNYEF